MSIKQCRKCADARICDSDWYEAANQCPYYRDKTWFDLLTSYPEKLAEKLVYRYDMVDRYGSSWILYKSTLFENGEIWFDKKCAIESTVRKLRETIK